MKIKAIHIIGILVVVAVIAGGYFFAQQQQPIVSGDKFVDYATELNINATQFRACLNSNKYDSGIKSDSNEAIRLKVGGTPTFFVNGQEIAGGTYNDLKAAIDTALANETLTNTVNLGNLPPKGNLSARVVVVEFSDFQCPFCQRAETTVKKIISDYGDKIKFVYMDLPLTNIHRFAEKSSNAARCANEQGKFWEYHDILYFRQSEWALS
jgi:protein-disulfide isomerase